MILHLKTIFNYKIKMEMKFKKIGKQIYNKF